MRTLLIALLLSVSTPIASLAQDLTLVRDGHSPFVIVVSANASLSERRGAKELQTHLWHMSGAQLPIETDLKPKPDHAIFVGRSRYTDAMRLNINTDLLGPEGFVIKSVD